MNRIIIIYVLILTIFASFQIKREYETEDLVIHLPFIMKLVDSNLYKNDFLFSANNPQANFSIYYRIPAEIIRLYKISTYDLFSVLRLIYFFSFFWLLLKISFKIFRRLEIGIGVSLLMLLKIPIGGTASLILETEVIPRAISTVFCLACGYFLLTGKKYQSLISFVLAFLIHPTSALLFSSLLIVRQIFNLIKVKKVNYKSIVTIMIFITGVGIIVHYLFPITDTWLNIIRSRNSYAFINLWSMWNWINLLILTVPGFIYIKYEFVKNKQFRKINLVTYISAAILTIVHILFTVIFPVSVIINLQLLRIWYYPAIVSMAVCAYVIFDTFKNINKVFYWFSVSLLIILIVWRNSIIKDVLNLSEWQQIQKWAATKTGTNCLFLVPFGSKGFRIGSERAISGEYKDGALSFYSEKFADEWNQRLTDLGRWQIKTDAEIVQMQKKYGINYLIESNAAQRQFVSVYKNRQYQIYQINKNCQ